MMRDLDYFKKKAAELGQPATMADLLLETYKLGRRDLAEYADVVDDEDEDPDDGSASQPDDDPEGDD